MGKAELKFKIDADLLARAHAIGVAVEAAAEEGVRSAVAAAEQGPGRIAIAHARQAADHVGAEARARQWAEENAEAIRAYNERIKRRGVFGDDLRRW